jgi:phage antirepressor YoqD-like protein
MGENESGDSPRDRDRDPDSGRYVEEYPRAAFVDAIREAGGSTGTREVADAVGCAYETAYKKLRAMEDADELTHRKVGNTRLWEVQNE